MQILLIDFYKSTTYMHAYLDNRVLSKLENYAMIDVIMSKPHK